MSEANELYLKISYKSKESFNNPLIIKQDMKEGINKYKVCGGMYSKNSRAIIFKINNLEEAYDVVNSCGLPCIMANKNPGEKQPGNADNIKGFRGYGGKS
jgi:hypothetical protein